MKTKQLIITVFLLLGCNLITAQEMSKYVFSAWVKEKHTTQQVNYSNSHISIILTVEVDDGNGNISLQEQSTPIFPSGNIIDGWQRIIGVLEVPSIFGISLVGNPNVDTYFDDVRVFPYNGNMKSFVYDEDTQRLMAELDENNYATFYEYDNEGGLVRVKKETEKGIYTIQETRSGNSKLNSQE